jgi:hypothetical protein
MARDVELLGGGLAGERAADTRDARILISGGFKDDESEFSAEKESIQLDVTL